jgi:hypothetical protein
VDGRGPEYYKLDHLHPGAELRVFGRTFRVTGADRAVLSYLEDSGVHLPAVCRDSLLEALDRGEEPERKHVKLPVA